MTSNGNTNQIWERLGDNGSCAVSAVAPKLLVKQLLKEAREEGVRLRLQVKETRCGVPRIYAYLQKTA